MNQSEVPGLFCVDMHETDGGEELYAAESPKMNQDTFQETTKFDVGMETTAVYTEQSNINSCLDEYNMSGIQPLGEIRFGSTQHFGLQAQGMMADSDEESVPSSPDTCSTNYDIPGYMEENIRNMYTTVEAKVDKEGTVVLCSDFIMCDNTLHHKPRLTVSSDRIEVEYLDLDSCEDNEMTALHWEISDIGSISCKWAQSIDSAFITLLAGSGAETGNSGPVNEWKICIEDSCWPRKQQSIWRLAARYQEIWKDIPTDDFTSGNWSIEPSLFFPTQYFSSTEDFEDVIYPKGDPDAVSISKRDADLLLPETFVNDTIIDFYIKYLSTGIAPTEKRRYHFFNSFFFRKLADLDKDQGRAPEGRAAFLRVRKWTRKINIFEKDFLFIPVNFNLHWSLIVICYPGEVVAFEDGEKKLSAKVPCILHMDSLKGSHTGLKDIIQSYLWEEWKERHPESTSDNSDKFLNLRFVSLEIPQQDNSFDCGLFLLHHVELFLMDVPRDFNPLDIDVFSGFLTDDWFPPAEASLKRSLIQKLINELVAGSFENYPKLAWSNEQLEEKHQKSKNDEREPATEFLSQRCAAGEPESVCAIRDGPHGTQPSTSICLNNSEEKDLSVSGCMLDAGMVSMVSVQNLQEPEVCPHDKETVYFSSQDMKNELILAESDNQLNTSACASKDGEVLEGSNHAVTDKEHEESLLVSLDDRQKISNQQELSVQDIMFLKLCSNSENAEVIASQEYSLHRKADEAGVLLCGPSQDMNSVMTPDTSKDDTGPNLERMTWEGDVSDLHEDMDSVTPGDINKDVADTKYEGSPADPMTTENATGNSAKEISTTEDNINRSHDYISSESVQGNTDYVDISKLKMGTSDNGGTNDSTVFSDDLNEGSTRPLIAGDCISQTNINADSKDASTYSTTDGVVPYKDDITCTDVEMPLIDRTCSEMTETNSESTNSDAKRLPDGICEEKDIVVSGDKCNKKDMGTSGKGTTSDNTVFSDDLNEGNTEPIITGDCTNQNDINADGKDDNTCSATNGALPCKDDTTCTDVEMPLVDKPCSEKTETVSENTTSDAKRPPDGICKEKGIVVSSDKCIKKDESHGTDAKSPLPDGIYQEKDIVISGGECIKKDDAHGTEAKRPLLDEICEQKDIVISDEKCVRKDGHGTDAKIQRHYKRRKVLAAELERQRSSSGAPLLD